MSLPLLKDEAHPEHCQGLSLKEVSGRHLTLTMINKSGIIAPNTTQNIPEIGNVFVSAEEANVLKRLA